jgi:hypothetical protein
VTEKIQPISKQNWRTPVSVFLWEIMVREAGMSKDMNRDMMTEKFGNLFPDATGDGPKERGELAVEVDLKINGVPVSFQKTCDEIWSRWEKQFDAEVLKKAKELVNSSRLSRLSEIISNAEWQLEQEIEALYNDRKSV